MLGSDSGVSVGVDDGVLDGLSLLESVVLDMVGVGGDTDGDVELVGDSVVT